MARRRVSPPNSGSQRAIDVISRLTHTGDFAGQPFDLRPWQEKILRQLFKTGVNGRRIYRSRLLMLPRKNGKTELAAAIALYSLLFDSQQGEIYLAAADRDQASKVFHAMTAMLQQDPELYARVEIVESQKRVVHRASGGFCRAISAEAYSKHGFNASLVIYDELHCAPDRKLYDVLVTSQGGRLDPQMIVISTAGYDRQSILWELYAHAKKVLENPALDPTFLPIIFEAPVEADWTSEKVWKACNPALGDFRSLEDMRILCQRAQQIPAQEMVFRQLYLNQWTESAARWLSLESWDACRSSLAAEDYRRALKGRRCYLGMDLSSTKDLTALVGVFPDGDGGFEVLCHLFCPHDTLKEREARDRVPYAQWAREGHLTMTSGNVVDYEAVRQLVKDWAAEFQIREIAFDPWNATDLVQRLQDQDGFTCVPMRQGFASLSAPTKSLEKAVLGKTLRHNGDPALRWCLGNVCVETDAAGNLKISKKVSTERIDAAAALVMAVDRMEHDQKPAPSFRVVVLR